MDVEAESIAGVAELMLTPPSDVLTEVTESGLTLTLTLTPTLRWLVLWFFPEGVGGRVSYT